MRFCNLILWDMKFQAKYGFYFLYAVLTAIYIVILFAIPKAWRSDAATILIFSDPAAMGLFFMGAIILLEKSQRVPCAFSVSPIRPMEYIASKVISLCVIATLVATIIAASTGARHLPLVFLGTALSGMIFTLLGLIVATKITSLNQFILWTVPIEMVGFVPAILYILGISTTWLRYYPANICIDMVHGNRPTILGIAIIMLLIGVLLLISYKCVLNMWRSLGGAKL